MEMQELIERARAEMEWHEVAAIFPLLSEDGLAGMADDIKRGGLLEPIQYVYGECRPGDHPPKLVVDGRNRQMACIKAGVSPVYTRIEFDGDRDELASRIWSLNYSRRHLTPSQLGMAAAEMRKWLTHGTIPDAAGVTGASQRNTERADRVLKEGSGALIESVQTGEVTLFEAEKIINLPKPEQTRRVKLFKAGKLRSVSRVPTPKPSPRAGGVGAWLEAVQEPYNEAIAKLNDVIEIVLDLEADVELSRYLPATRIRVDLQAAKNNLYQNYPLVWHGGPDATAETHPETGGVGFMTRFVWSGLSLSEQEEIVNKEGMDDGTTETDDIV
jgi:hypothetical protein